MRKSLAPIAAMILLAIAASIGVSVGTFRGYSLQEQREHAAFTAGAYASYAQEDIAVVRAVIAIVLRQIEMIYCNSDAGNPPTNPHSSADPITRSSSPPSTQ